MSRSWLPNGNTAINEAVQALSPVSTLSVSPKAAWTKGGWTTTYASPWTLSGDTAINARHTEASRASSTPSDRKGAQWYPGGWTSAHPGKSWLSGGDTVINRMVASTTAAADAPSARWYPRGWTTRYHLADQAVTPQKTSARWTATGDTSLNAEHTKTFSGSRATNGKVQWLPRGWTSVHQPKTVTQIRPHVRAWLPDGSTALSQQRMKTEQSSKAYGNGFLRPEWLPNGWSTAIPPQSPKVAAEDNKTVVQGSPIRVAPLYDRTRPAAVKVQPQPLSLPQLAVNRSFTVGTPSSTTSVKTPSIQPAVLNTAGRYVPMPPASPTPTASSPRYKLNAFIPVGVSTKTNHITVNNYKVNYLQPQPQNRQVIVNSSFAGRQNSNTYNSDSVRSTVFSLPPVTPPRKVTNNGFSNSIFVASPSVSLGGSSNSASFSRPSPYGSSPRQQYDFGTAASSSPYATAAAGVRSNRFF